MKQVTHQKISIKKAAWFAAALSVSPHLGSAKTISSAGAAKNLGDTIRSVEPPQKTISLPALCFKQLSHLPGSVESKDVADLCATAEQLPSCVSAKEQPIYHFESKGSRYPSQKVLVIGLIHGDEEPGGSIARRWAMRLANLNARSSWRVIPISNPDGWDLNQRMNANGVDINRNFPTSDWHSKALSYWKNSKNSDPRRFPGPQATSEPETKCLLEQIDDYKPDFVVAIHTPYGVLDFDGPKLSAPRFPDLPWVSMGTFPGSMGRYLWLDRKIPVLTVELKDNSLLRRVDKADLLQDISGTVAIRAHRSMQSIKADSSD